MAFRENILHLRAANNMTQEQLAVLVGVSRQSVAKWEAGKAYPEMDKLIKLSQIFNCSIDALVQGDLTDREADATISVADTAQDLFGYDEFMRRFAYRVCNGIMFILLGVAFSSLCFSIADQGALMVPASMDIIFTTLGVMIVLAGVAIGLFYIIPAGLDHSAFMQEHPYLEDFYTKSQKSRARQSFSNQLLAGIVCIFIGVCLVVALSMTELTEVFGSFCLLICVAIGVRLIVNAGMTLSRVDINAYNVAAMEKGLGGADVSGSMPEGCENPYFSYRKKDARASACCGIVMIIATIAGLVMLFVPEYQTDLFWLAWPIGALVCAIVSLLFKAISGSES